MTTSDNLANLTFDEYVDLPSPSADDSDSADEFKPDLDSDEDFETKKGKRGKKSSPKNTPSPKKRSPKSASGGKREVKRWSDEEEAKFAKIAEDVLKQYMWPAAKAEGSLSHRGADGVRKHITTFLNKTRKA